MEEGVIAELNIQEGDTIEAGDVIAEVETDKATMEWESFVEGTVLHLVVSSGDSVPVNGIVAVLGEEGEDWQAVLDEAAEDEAGEPSSAEDDVDEPSAASPTPDPAPDPVGGSTSTASQSSNGRIKASPLARRMADDLGIDLGRVSGTGDEGRIVKRDIEAYDGPTGGEEQKPASSGLNGRGVHAIPHSGRDRRGGASRRDGEHDAQDHRASVGREQVLGPRTSTSR